MEMCIRDSVNTETGKVTVEKFTCVADVGTIMNRLLVEGNVYGGLVQGIGLALTEVSWFRSSKSSVEQDQYPVQDHRSSCLLQEVCS